MMIGVKMNNNKKNHAKAENRIPCKLRTKSDFMHSFFFIKPQSGADINELADKLVSIENVDEVCVTEGDIGYMVKAKFDDNTYDKVERSIAAVAGPKYGRFVSAMDLKKAVK